MPLSPSPFVFSQSKTLSVTNVDTANDVILMALQQLGINVSPCTSFNESFCSHFYQPHLLWHFFQVLGYEHELNPLSQQFGDVAMKQKCLFNMQTSRDHQVP